MTRRAFLGAAVGVGSLAVPLAGAAFASGRTVYGLVPHWGDTGLSCAVGAPGRSCTGCSACATHAEHKVFASAAAADGGRAHLGCRCLVTPLSSVDPATFGRLFASGQSADRRHAGVSQLLAGTSAPSGLLPLTGSSIGMWATVGAAAVAAGAALQLAAWRTQAVASSSTASTAAKWKGK